MEGRRHLRVLILEDSEDDALLLLRELQRGGYEVEFERVYKAQEMQLALNQKTWDLILSDYSMPEFNASRALELMKDSGLDLPFIIVSGTIGEETAVAALKAGADDFLVKGKFSRLVPAIERELREAESRRERRRAEEQLRQSEENFSKAFNSSPTALMITRRSDGKYLELNAAYTSIVGYERAELIGHLSTEFNIFIHPDQRKEIISQLVANGSLYNYEAQIQNKSGELRTVLASLELIQFNGEDCILSTLVDITERKQAEEAVRAKNEEIKAMSQQLWQAAKLATMGELAASIAHELNNPLATVSLRAEILQAKLAPEDPQSKSLQIIVSEVKRMSGLVMNLLQFSRRSSSQISTINVNKELGNTLELVQYHLRKNSILTVQELSPEIPPVQADRQQVRQVFLNLFTNATDAMPLGGMLTIRSWSGDKPDAGITAPLRSFATQSLGLPASDQPQVFIEVSDSGEGIPPDKLERVWEPFYTTKPEGKGTGLGLAICRRIIQEHGGTIEMFSEGIPGKGTTVRLSLPAVKER